MTRLIAQLTPIIENINDFVGKGEVILLHPRSKFRSLIVAHFLQQDDIQTFYFSVGVNDTDLTSFLTGLINSVASQHPSFGQHLNRHAANFSENSDALVKALAQDLRELSDETFILILDEYDSSDMADDIQVFMERLIDYLPEQCTLFISSRTLPRLSWISIIAKGRAVILDDERLVTENFYDTRKTGETVLEVFSLGPGFVLLNYRPIDTWEGHLPRLLFFFALDRPVITRSEICASFWPELDVDQAVNVFHVTKRRLHKALDMDVLLHENNVYRLNPALNIEYDAMQFATQLLQGRGLEGIDRFRKFQAAADLYRGPFLKGHNDAWIETRRLDFQRGYIEALTEMGYMRLSENRTEQALNLFKHALDENPFNEPLHRQVMQHYQQLGRYSEAIMHYRNLETEYRQHGMNLEPETDALYRDIFKA